MQLRYCLAIMCVVRRLNQKGKNRTMFVKIGKRYINMANVAHLLIQENLDHSFSYRFTFLQDTILEYRTTDIEEITGVNYAIAILGRPTNFEDSGKGL